MEETYNAEEDVEITTNGETSIFFWTYVGFSHMADALCLDIHGSDGVYETFRIDFNDKEELLEMEREFIEDSEYIEGESSNIDTLIMYVFKQLKDSFEEYNSFRLSCNV